MKGIILREVEKEIEFTTPIYCKVCCDPYNMQISWVKIDDEVVICIDKFGEDFSITTERIAISKSALKDIYFDPARRCSKNDFNDMMETAISSFKQKSN